MRGNRATRLGVIAAASGVAVVVGLGAWALTAPTPNTRTSQVGPSLISESSTTQSPSPTAAVDETPTPSPTPTETPSAAPAPAPPAAEAPGGTGSGSGGSSSGGAGAVSGPTAGATWQYQLSGNLDLSVDAAVFDIDWVETSAAEVAQLHASGRTAICYFSAGSSEDWRPDIGSFPSAALGSGLDGWPGERWLDIRNTGALLPIMAARMDVCRQKGFDAVEPDNVDGYNNDTGFPLTAQDQIAYNTALARLAHERGMSIGLKNDIEQVGQLQPSFDFAVNEECLAYGECGAYAAFASAGKAVFHVEYERPSAASCAAARSQGLSTIVKDLDLGPALSTC